MKMLFYTSDDLEVQRLKQELAAARIECEVRPSPAVEASAQAEIWIINDKDCYRAFLLCTRLSLGFARRAERPPSGELEMDLEFLPD
jgi:hypothetical protein